MLVVILSRVSVEGFVSDGLLVGLMRLHELASRSGEGLRPEFAELLDREMDQARQGVIRLQMPITRTLPGRQLVSAEELQALGIPVLGRGKPPTDNGDTAEPDKTVAKSESKGGTV